MVRATVQPLMLLILWHCSKLEMARDDFQGRHLKLFGRWPKMTGSLVPLQQLSLLTTLVEMLIFWTPVVPLLGFAILATALANLFMFNAGLWNFRVILPTDEMNRGASISTSYLQFALWSGSFFQIWYAFGTKLFGRYALLAVHVTIMGPWAKHFLPVDLARRCSDPRNPRELLLCSFAPSDERLVQTGSEVESKAAELLKPPLTWGGNPESTPLACDLTDDLIATPGVAWCGCRAAWDCEPRMGSIGGGFQCGSVTWKMPRDSTPSGETSKSCGLGLLEMLIFWTPFVPLLGFAILAAALANLFMFDAGLWNFQVTLPTDEMNRGAAISTSYLQFALWSGSFFQIWYAFGTKLFGRHALLAVHVTIMGPWAKHFLPVDLAKRENGTGESREIGSDLGEAFPVQEIPIPSGGSFIAEAAEDGATPGSESGGRATSVFTSVKPCRSVEPAEEDAAGDVVL
ncbi:Uncharacterized protein SCF082_LOCUS28607 [Durusdinium trenchii]|uniref:CSC1/OSCA1-like 7TM region domain-containing protein n=1 Tax=Durusdinium trenchii TaxID=1381693 RepID=A0ABP0MM24_9DINO